MKTIRCLVVSAVLAFGLSVSCVFSAFAEQTSASAGSVGVWWWNGRQAGKPVEYLPRMDFLASNRVTEIYFAVDHNAAFKDLAAFVAAATARNFARSCGVTEAVLDEATRKIPGFKLNAKQINGIDRKSCGMLKLYASGKLPANFLEVMACPGGCVNGPCSLKA